MITTHNPPNRARRLERTYPFFLYTFSLSLACALLRDSQVFGAYQTYIQRLAAHWRLSTNIVHTLDTGAVRVRIRQSSVRGLNHRGVSRTVVVTQTHGQAKSLQPHSALVPIIENSTQPANRERSSISSNMPKHLNDDDDVVPELVAAFPMAESPTLPPPPPPPPPPQRAQQPLLIDLTSSSSDVSIISDSDAIKYEWLERLFCKRVSVKMLRICCIMIGLYHAVSRVHFRNSR